MQILQRGGKNVWACGLVMMVVAASGLLSSAAAQEGTPRKGKRANLPAAEAFPSSNATEGTPGQAELPPDLPLTKALKKAYSSRDALAEVKDYSALFVRKERIRQTGKFVEQVMDVKLRHEPFSVYMKFRTPETGREVIFVAGQNNNQLLVHEEGIKKVAGTITLPLNDPRVTKESRHPITRMGIAKMLDVIIAQWEAETKFSEVEVKRYPKANLAGIPCEAWVAIHPKARQDFRFHKTVLYFEKKTNLPIRVEQWYWPQQEGGQPILVEEYTYRDLQTNVNLNDIDFSTRNPQYRF